MGVEAILGAVAFVALFGLWVVLPSRTGEEDLGSKIRERLRRR